MLQQTEQFSVDPKSILTCEVDCIWIFLKHRERPTPLVGSAIQWIDWRLQGVISRLVRSQSYQRSAVTFFPTMHRVTTPYVAVAYGEKLDWKKFFKNSEGMGLRHVVILCEAGRDREKSRQVISQYSSSSFLSTVRLADAPKDPS